MSNDGWSEGFRDRLQVLQDRYGISKAAMARKCGMPPRTLENYFKGHKPGVEALLSISRGLGIDIDWLLGEDSEAKNFNTDLVSEAVYLAATRLLHERKELVEREGDIVAGEVLGLPFARFVGQLAREVVREYLVLRISYATKSLSDAKTLEEALRKPSE